MCYHHCTFGCAFLINPLSLPNSPCYLLFLFVCVYYHWQKGRGSSSSLYFIFEGMGCFVCAVWDTSIQEMLTCEAQMLASCAGPREPLCFLPPSPRDSVTSIMYGCYARCFIPPPLYSIFFAKVAYTLNAGTLTDCCCSCLCEKKRCFRVCP